MNKKEKTKLVPKYRFPEFNNSDSWNRSSLSKLADRVEEKVGGIELITLSISAGTGFISQEEKFSRDISGSQYKNYIHLRKGDFSYNKGNSKTFPQGCIYELLEYEEAAVPNAFISFHFKDCYISGFYKGYFENNFHGKQLVKFITSGARMDGLLNIKPSEFFSIILPTPKERDEQQKIADCLSSIDDLISAEEKNLSLLEKHKKCLMQKLFPSEGKTVPEWRFPEFRNSHTWDVKPLSKVCINLDSKRIPITGNKRNSGTTPYYGASGIVDHVNGFIFDEYLLCVSEDGANLVARTYPIAFSISGRTWVNNHAHVLKFHNVFTQVLVENYLNHIELSNYLTGMAQPKLNRAKLDIIPIPLPDEKEQKKVADLFSSVDELITAQVDKIEALKKHKKGLMQGLFPSIEEVSE